MAQVSSLADHFNLQGQYWAGSSEYRFIPVLEFADAFDKSNLGRARVEDLATPFDKEAAAAGRIDPLVYTKHALRGEPLCCKIMCAPATQSLL